MKYPGAADLSWDGGTSQITFPFLTTMIMDHGHTDITKQSIFPVLNCPALKTYHATYAYEIEDSHFCDSFFSRCHHLVHLVLIYAQISTIMPEIIHKLPETLQVLDLGSHIIEGNCMPNLKYLLQHRKSLVAIGHEFDLGCSKLPKDDMETLGCLLSINRAQLRTLSVQPESRSLWPLMLANGEKVFNCEYGKKVYDVCRFGVKGNEFELDHLCCHPESFHEGELDERNSPPGLVTKEDGIYQMLRLKGFNDIIGAS